MNYVQRMRDLREDNQFKQVDIAQRLNILQPQYSVYERGVQELPIRHLIELCKLYNVSADYLLGFTDEFKPLPKK